MYGRLVLHTLVAGYAKRRSSARFGLLQELWREGCAVLDNRQVAVLASNPQWRDPIHICRCHLH